MPTTPLLLNGYRRFYSKHFQGGAPVNKELAHGQSPKTLFIACSDSRVDPAIITDADPGDIFVIRNVANLVPPLETDSGHHGTSAALEFAVRHLKVEHIVVLGHSSCGGINALLHNTASEDTTFIRPWMELAAKAREYTLKVCGSVDHPDATRNCEQQGILVSLQNLRSFPFVAEREEAGKLRLHGWYFRVDTGQLQAWDAQEASFRTVPAE